MSVIIVSDDAERLVREGGVHNLRAEDWPTLPGMSLVQFLSSAERHTEVTVQFRMWTDPKSYQIHTVGTVRVVDVHHADDCYAEDPNIAWAAGWCHPDAEPYMWHWIVEPAA